MTHVRYIQLKPFSPFLFLSPQARFTLTRSEPRAEQDALWAHPVMGYGPNSRFKELDRRYESQNISMNIFLLFERFDTGLVYWDMNIRTRDWHERGSCQVIRCHSIMPARYKFAKIEWYILLTISHQKKCCTFSRWRTWNNIRVPCCSRFIYNPGICAHSASVLQHVIA
jgi:hypothetical protein